MAKKPKKKAKAKPRKKPAVKPRKKPVPKPKRKPAPKPKAKPKRRPAPKPQRKPAPPEVRKKRQKRVNKLVRRALKRKKPETRWKVIQRGPILLETRGYFCTINALVPGAWATASSPVFESDETADDYHMVVWRTPVRDTLQKVLHDYDELLIGQTVYSEVQGMDYLILSGELMMLHEDLSSYRIKLWSGSNPPRWLRRTAKRQSKAKV